MISAFDMYKIGVGPSSSHTNGPMRAGKAFGDELVQKNLLDQVNRVEVIIYGSLSLTGKGHHTDRALLLGLAGNLPDTVDLDIIPGFLDQIAKEQTLMLAGQKQIAFPPESLVWSEEFLPKHENGVTFKAYKDNELVYQNTYYSVGGGFIEDEESFGKAKESNVNWPYPYTTADEVVRYCTEQGLSISAFALQNELAVHTQAEIDAHFARVWEVMNQCIERGVRTEGVLPGPLRVMRRAPGLRRILVTSDRTTIDPLMSMDWINMYALAVSEENASGGRVVTSPTNGACGIIPAVLAYYNKFIREVNPNAYSRFFLASAVIGALYKMNASLSGAEVGCQGEVGVACSMAAAGLAELLGASPIRVCMAAEIAMEHSLGLTCDPVNGQVQVPCIERNAIYAVKAVNAARMAMRRASPPSVSLDKVIQTMYLTGKDMNAKYRETSRGGLAITVMSKQSPKGTCCM